MELVDLNYKQSSQFFNLIKFFPKNNKYLIILMGFPATGKSTIAKYLNSQYLYKIFRTDLIRKEVYSSKDLYKRNSVSDRNKIYQIMVKYAENFLKTTEWKESRGIIFDGTFIIDQFRNYAFNFANNHNLNVVILHTVCEEQAAIKRIHKRTKNNYESNALHDKAYFDNKKLFSPICFTEIKQDYPHTMFSYFKIETTSTQGPQYNKIIEKLYY